MIREALRHCPGIGPARLAKLHEAGVRSWQDAIERSEQIPAGWREGILEECRNCLAALAASDIDYFVRRLSPHDKWRILAHFLEHTSVFDIETTGLEYDAPISVICCWHRGQLHTFIEGENLDDFLDLLDDVTLLTSFNGGSFDVPRVLDSFHIPKLPCPHLDLRWLCYHQGHRGGLKQISRRLGIQRPHDLSDVDGELAIRLWARWEHFQDQAARELLIRYCGSDVLLTVMLAYELAGQKPNADLWSRLPEPTATTASDTSTTSNATQTGSFGEASPSRLRAWRRMVS